MIDGHVLAHSLCVGAFHCRLDMLSRQHMSCLGIQKLDCRELDEGTEVEGCERAREEVSPKHSRVGSCDGALSDDPCQAFIACNMSAELYNGSVFADTILLSIRGGRVRSE